MDSFHTPLLVNLSACRFFVCVFTLWCGKCFDVGSTIALVKPLNQWTNVYTNAPTYMAKHHCGIKLRRGVHHGWIQQLVQ